MDRLELAQVRAAEALQLKANPMFAHAFTDVRAAIVEAWASLDDVNSEKARDLHRMLKCLDRVKKCLDTHIDSGKIAAAEVDGRRQGFLSALGRRVA